MTQQRRSKAVLTPPRRGRQEGKVGGRGRRDGGFSVEATCRGAGGAGATGHQRWLAG
jgi:hypothetical protein